MDGIVTYEHVHAILYKAKVIHMAKYCKIGSISSTFDVGFDPTGHTITSYKF